MNGLRRFVGILLVIVLMCSVVGAYWESMDEGFSAIHEYCKSSLEGLKTVYSFSPEKFDDDYIYLTYTICKTDMALQDVLYAAKVYKAKMAAGGAVIVDKEYIGESESGSLLIYETLGNSFKDWTEGKKTREEFLELLMSLVDVTLSAE